MAFPSPTLQDVTVNGSANITTAAITGGAIDGTTIGGTTPAAVNAANLTATGTVSGTGITNLLNPYALLTSLAATGATPGSTLIGYQNTGTNSVTQTLQTRSEKFLLASDYSTVADAQVEAIAQGKGILFTAGTYPIASTLSLTVDIVFTPGALLQPASTIALSISSDINAGDYQIFDLSAGGTVSLTAKAVKMHGAWFGMSPSETAANNTTFFTNAIASAPASDGAEIMLPSGQINVNTLSVTKSGISVVGHSAGTWLINNTTNAPAIEQNTTTWGSLRRLRIGQSASVTPVSGNMGYRLLGTDECTVEDIVVFNFPAACYDGALYDNANNCHVARVVCNNNANHGFHFTNGSDGSFVDMWSFSNVAAGFQFDGVSGFQGVNLHAYGNFNGFVFPTAFTNQFVYGVNWYADTSDSYNWQIQNLNRSSFTNAWGATQKSTTVNTFANGFFISGSTVFDVVFNGGHAINNNSHGVYITSSATGIRFNNFVSGGTQPNGAAGAGSGFRMGLVTHCGMVNCYSHNNPTNGLTLEAAASDYLTIGFNDFSGNTASSLNNGSTGTNNQIANNAV